ncbi:MAG: hypothetical protein IT304_04445 [Dehalococcoidia bacterium]|nr:hypothetical protein [Dehalococcoidia bacterium]
MSEVNDEAKGLDEPSGRPDPRHSKAISVRTTRRDELLRRLEGPEEDVLQPIGSANVDDRNEVAAHEQYRLEQVMEERESEGEGGRDRR